MVIIIIAITAGVFVWMSQKNNPIRTDIQIATLKIPADETLSWKIYTNAEFGYKMKYPAAFTEPAGPHLSNNPAASVSQENKGLAFQVQFFMEAFGPINNLEEAFQTSIRGNGYQERLKRDIVFNGKPAIEYAGYIDSRQVHAMVGELNGKFFDLVVESRNNSKEADSLFQKVFANFKAIGNDTSDWQTYRDEKYGFEFKYPKELLVKRTDELDYYEILNNLDRITEFSIIKWKGRKIEEGTPGTFWGKLAYNNWKYFLDNFDKIKSGTCNAETIINVPGPTAGDNPKECIVDKKDNYIEVETENNIIFYTNELEIRWDFQINKNTQTKEILSTFKFTN